MSHKSDTQIEQRAFELDPKLALALKGRRVENIGFYVGLGVAVFTATLESLKHYGVLGNCTTAGLPWVNLVVIFMCVGPKMLGRATVGKWFESLPFIGKK
jgi:hypothetical protein